MEAILDQAVEVVPSPPTSDERSAQKTPEPPVTDVPAETPSKARVVAPSTATVEPRSPKPAPTPGRGGLRHKAIQRKIKQFGEGLGWRGSIEQPVLDGRGAVDVALYKGDMSIACEISITTPTDRECANLAKCIEAGFNHVVMICDSTERLEKVKEKASKTLDEVCVTGIHFFLVEQVFDMLHELEQTVASSESYVRGRHIKVNRRQLSAADRVMRQKSVERAVAQSVVRRNQKGAL